MTGALSKAGCRPFYEIYRVLGVENFKLASNKDKKEEVRWHY